MSRKLASHLLGIAVRRNSGATMRTWRQRTNDRLRPALVALALILAGCASHHAGFVDDDGSTDRDADISTAGTGGANGQSGMRASGSGGGTAARGVPDGSVGDPCEAFEPDYCCRDVSRTSANGFISNECAACLCSHGRGNQECDKDCFRLARCAADSGCPLFDTTCIVDRCADAIGGVANLLRVGEMLQETPFVECEARCFETPSDEDDAGMPSPGGIAGGSDTPPAECGEDGRIDSAACADCGNGLRDGDEECDDSDREGGDGCDPYCKVEPVGPQDVASCDRPPPGQSCGATACGTGSECIETSGVSCLCNDAVVRSCSQLRSFMLPTPGGARGCMPNAISADGLTVVGSCDNAQGFVWTRATGSRLLVVPSDPQVKELLGVNGDGTVAVGYSTTIAARIDLTVPPVLTPLPGIGFDVSDDGSVVVGDDGTNQGFRWEAGNTTYLSGNTDDRSVFVRGVSDDGRIALGMIGASGSLRPARWNTAGQLEELLMPGGAVESEVLAASADGSIIVGTAVSATRRARAVRWTDAGIHELGVPSCGAESTAVSVSADGSVVVGSTYVPDLLRNEVIVWDEAHGMRTARAILGELSEWMPPMIGYGVDISADGKVVLGGGQLLVEGPDSGKFVGFVIELP